MRDTPRAIGGDPLSLPRRVQGGAPGPQALEGVRIIDFTRLLAGPLATQILADFGAEVIKVEMPGRGDDARTSMPDPQIGGESAFYLSLNRNKKSVTLDLRDPEGRRVAYDLISTADVVVENFNSRVMRGFELDYESLREHFPRLIYCAVSAYGRSGSMSEVAGVDSPVTADSGMASLNARPGERPVMNAVPMTDTTTGMYAAMAILLALQARERTGRGQMVEAAMYDCAVSTLGFRGYEYLISGKEPELSPLQFRRGTPRGQFDTMDGAIWVIAGADKMFAAFARHVVDRPEWVEDARFRDAASRVEHADCLNSEIAQAFLTQRSDYWVERCRKAGVPCGALRSVGEALSSPFTAERELVYAVDHPTAGAVPVIASPIKMHGTPAAIASAPPLLGQQTEQVLKELLGYDDVRISALVDRGIASV